MDRKELIFSRIDKLLRSGKLYQAFKECDGALREFPGDSDLKKLKCRALITGGNYEEARADLLTWFREGEQSDPEIFYMLGRCCFETGEFGDARRYLEHARSLSTLDPDLNADVVKILGKTYIKTKKTGLLVRLIGQLKKSVFADEMMPAALYLEAALNISLEKKNAAMQNLLEASLFRRSDPDCLELLRSMNAPAETSARLYLLTVSGNFLYFPKGELYSCKYLVLANSLEQALTFIRNYEKPSGGRNLQIVRTEQLENSGTITHMGIISVSVFSKVHRRTSAVMKFSDIHETV